MSYDRIEGPFSGFLLIKCEECGAVNAYCTKIRRYAHRCKACGEYTPLEALKPVYMECRCGRKYRYLTNIGTRTFVHTCMGCGRKVTLMLGRKKTAYVTAWKSWYDEEEKDG